MNKKILLGCILGAVIIALSVGGVFIFANKECSHDYGAWQVITEADCTSGGLQERVCSKCGEKETATVGIAGHNWKEANCKAPKTCARCGKTEGDLGGHSYTKQEATDETFFKAASCSHGALYFKTCEFCGEVSTNEADVFESGEKLAHDFTKEVVSEAALKSAATCAQKAVYFKSCSVCGEVSANENDVFESGEKLAHAFTKEDSTAKGALCSAATCTSAAKYYKSCAVCGEVSKSAADTFTEGSAGSHSFTAEELKSSADCENKATYYKKCSICGAKGATFTKGSPLGHDFSIEDEDVAGAKIAQPTCTENAKYHKSCSKCNKVSTSNDDWFYGTKSEDKAKGHDFSETAISEGALKTAATCKSYAVYYKSCIECGEPSESDDDTFNGTTYAAHDFTKETVSEATKKSDATCTSAAKYYKSCATEGCTAISTYENDVFESGDKLDHDFTNEDVTVTDALCSAATCTEKAKYYKSCTACGEVNKDDSDTFENGEPKGHSLYEASRVDATCTAPAKVTYKCHNCTHEKTKDEGAALGHDIKDVEAVIRQSEDKVCIWYEYYKCKREGCTGEVKGEKVEKHAYTASITQLATCTNTGTKTFTCSECSAVKTEDIPKDEVNGHNWELKATDGAKKTYKCSICEKEKTVIDASTETATNVSAGDLAGNEIALKNASISMDSNAANGIGDKDVKLSVGKTEGDARNGIPGVNADALEQIGDNPIYNFEVSTGDGDDDKISNFSGSVTVTVPYTLATDEEGNTEDVDSLAVWYIASDGSLKSIEATYSEDADGKGYITFVTNHFSYYTVTRLSAEERCLLYGCNISTKTVEATCVSEGYTLKTCIRCHKVKKTDIVPALGHKYETTTVAATCLENGYIEYKCKTCGLSYKTTLLATGHKYKEDESKAIASTCTENGSKRYVCENGCGTSYTVAQPLKAHELQSTVTEPTCGEGGYTEHKCAKCDYSYKDGYTAALGHEYDYDDEQKTVWTWKGLTAETAALRGDISASVTLNCLRCGATTEDIAATVSFKFKYGKCSGYFKVTVTAAVVLEDGVHYDEHSFTTGNENHKFNETKHDETSHWLECMCGEKSNVEKHAFGTPVITKQPTCGDDGKRVYTCSCGFKKEEVIPASGSHSFVNGGCSTCGASMFYTNVVASVEKAAGLELIVENFSLYEVNVNVDDGSYVRTELLKQLDVIKLVLFYENGELKGEGVANLVYYDGAVWNCELYIEKGNSYLKYVTTEKVDGKDVSQVYYASMPAEILAASLVNSIIFRYGNVNLSAVNKLEQFCESYVSPAIKAIAKAYPDKAETLLNGLFNMAFTLEKTEYGYNLTLDYNKLYALNDALAQKPVAEVIDEYFGNGTFDKLASFVLTAVEVELGDIPEKLAAVGISEQKLYAAVAELYKNVCGTDINVEEWLEENGEKTLGALMFGVEDGSYYDYIADGIIPVLRENSLYSLLASSAEDVQYEVKAAIDQLKQYISLDIVTNGSGAVKAINGKLSGDMNVNGDFKFNLTDSAPELSLGGLVGEVDGAIVSPKGEIAEELGYNKKFYDYNEWDYSDSISFGEETFEYVRRVSVCEFVKGDNRSALTSPSCTNWVGIRESYECTGCWFQYYFGADNKVLLKNGSTYVTLEQGEIGFVLSLDDGRQITYGFDFAYDNLGEAYAALAREVMLALDVEPYGYYYGYGYRYSYYYYYNTETGEFSSKEPHKYVETFEFLTDDEDCESGVKIIRTCSVCGDSYSYETTSHDYTNELGMLEGFCSNIVYGECTRCHNNSSWKWMGGSPCSFVATDNTTEEGYVIYTCSNCGNSYYEYDITSEKDENCNYTETSGAVFLKGDEEVLRLETVDRYTSHNYRYVYEFLTDDKDCESGVKVTIKCLDCGDIDWEYERINHNYSYTIENLTEFGFCGVDLELYECEVCGKADDSYLYWYNWNDDCNFVKTENVTEEGYVIYTCGSCGGSYYEYYIRSDKNENCEYVLTYGVAFIMNDEEVYRAEKKNYYNEHEFNYEYEFAGATCEDGVTVTYSCKNCDSSYRKTINSHQYFRSYTLPKGKWCDKHRIEVLSCPCGYRISYNYDNSYGTCSDCGLKFESGNDLEGDCTAIRNTHVSISYKGETLYSLTNVDKGFKFNNHSYGEPQIVTAENGVSYVVSTCSDCDATASSELSAVTSATFDENGIYNLHVTVESDYSLLLFDRDVGISDKTEAWWNNYHNNFPYLILGAGEHDITVRRYYYNDDNDEQFNYAFLSISNRRYYSYYSNADVINGAYCAHGNTSSFSVLLPGGASCEDGVLGVLRCNLCGEVIGAHLSYEHITYETYIELSDYGACPSKYSNYIYYRVCACSQKVETIYVDCYGCSYKTENNSYIDDEGHLVNVETCYCSKCGLFYQLSYYVDYDSVNCSKVTHYTYMVTIDKTTVFNYSYSETSEWHDYAVTYKFANGGTTCDDGFTVTYTCKNCGYAYDDNFSGHYQVITEKIDLSEYGCVCGGYAELRRCPCGLNVDMSLEGALCDFDGHGYDGVDWVDGAIYDSQCNSSGERYLSTCGDIYTCSVTDPADKACGFKIRCIRYWLKAEGECKAYRYVTYQFGYNSEDGSCAFEKTFEKIAVAQWHNYDDGEQTPNEDGYVYTCACGSTYTVRDYTDEEGRYVHKRVAINALQNEFNQSYSYVVIWTNDENGKEIKHEERSTYVDRNGNETFDGYTYGYEWHEGAQYVSYRLDEYINGWSRWDYDYDFTNADGLGCIRTCTYTNSDGANEVRDPENCCRFAYDDENIIKYPTCTQNGSVKLVCRVCKTEKIAEMRSWQEGHTFVELENGRYFCSLCGLENANGTDGDIVLEDLTSAYGNGENYVVGYRLNTNAKFERYVTIILAGEQDILLNGVEFSEVEGLTAVAFSKAQVAELAKAALLEKGFAEDTYYEVRLSFVPDGASSLDYAITFTPEQEVTSITDSGTFICRVPADNLKLTLTPSVSGAWSFEFAIDGYSHLSLYDENGKYISSNRYMYDGESRSFELEAGKTYTLEIETHGGRDDYYLVIPDNDYYSKDYYISINNNYVGLKVTAPQQND